MGAKIVIDSFAYIHNHTVVNYLSTTFAALAEPTRRKIIDRLTRGPATVNELARPFAISQQAISKHLAYLERARLIRKRREGRQHFCVLNPKAIQQVANWSENFRDLWEKRFRSLDSLLEEMKSANGADGIGDIEGKVARESDERVGRRASFKSAVKKKKGTK